MPDGMHSIERNHSGTVSTSVKDTTQDQKNKKKRKMMLAILAGTTAKIALGGYAYWALVASHYVSTDNAYVGASSAQINALVAGAVADVKVDETHHVKRGDVLAVIDPADAKLAVARAEADYGRTVQRVSQYYAQRSIAAAQLKARQADHDKAEADFDRRQALAQTGAVSKEEQANARAMLNVARANLIAAEEQLEAQNVLTRGFTIETHPETLAAKATLETAKLDLTRTVITAPVDGIVAQKKLQVGQRVAPGQALMTVTPLADAHVDANFKEVQLRNVAVGQVVELTSDLYGEDVVFHGRVEGLGGGTGSAFAVIPAQNATGNWIKVVQRVPVRIALDPEEIAQYPLRVGLSMNATIDTRTKTF